MFIIIFWVVCVLGPRVLTHEYYEDQRRAPKSQSERPLLNRGPTEPIQATLSNEDLPLTDRALLTVISSDLCRAEVPPGPVLATPAEQSFLKATLGDHVDQCPLRWTKLPKGPFERPLSSRASSRPVWVTPLEQEVPMANPSDPCRKEAPRRTSERPLSYGGPPEGQSERPLSNGGHPDGLRRPLSNGGPP